MLNTGDPAPEIALLDQNGSPFRLSDLRGKTVVLFFYPKADTSGCTTEACGFRDAEPEYKNAGIVLVGISPDTSKKQWKFAEKFGLPYTLLADVEHAAAETYGLWIEKTLYGRKYMGVDRTTFVIGPDGNLSHIFRKVKVEGHAAAVLTALQKRGRRVTLTGKELR